MDRRYWIDISSTANGGRRRIKPHVAYDGKRIMKIRNLSELVAAKEVYIDSLPPEIYDDILQLLSRGVKVYLLTNTKLIKQRRIEKNLSKSDENDAKILSTIEKSSFRELTLEEIEIKRKPQPLLEKYDIISRRLKKVKQWSKDDCMPQELKLLEKALRRERSRIAREIIDVAENSLKMYKLAENKLGLKGVSLVALLFYIDFSRGISKIKQYARCNRKVRRVLASYATSIYINVKKGAKIRNYAEVVAQCETKTSALKKIQTRILKDLRLLWRQNAENKEG